MGSPGDANFEITGKPLLYTGLEQAVALRPQTILQAGTTPDSVPSLRDMIFFFLRTVLKGRPTHELYKFAMGVFYLGGWGEGGWGEGSLIGPYLCLLQ